jgi:hypothetical protein
LEAIKAYAVHFLIVRRGIMGFEEDIRHFYMHTYRQEPVSGCGAWKKVTNMLKCCF